MQEDFKTLCDQTELGCYLEPVDSMVKINKITIFKFKLKIINCCTIFDNRLWNPHTELKGTINTVCGESNSAVQIWR